MSALEALGTLNSRWEPLRKQKIAEFNANLSKYHSRLECLVQRYGREHMPYEFVLC